jgi:phospholipid/cholesterol/gamma-HCH transport system substrate-binding protein
MTRFQKIRVGAIAMAGLVLLVIWIGIRPKVHKLRLTASFENVRGLRQGASVRIAGVDVGYASNVEAHPESKDCLAEVNMTLETPYNLTVPSDAIARVESTGLLGAEFFDIDVRAASGRPTGDNARLKTAPTIPPLEAIKTVVKAASAECADCASKQQGSAPTTKP